MNSSHHMFVLYLQLKEDIQVRNNESQRESRKKEKLEREYKTAKNELESKTAESKSKQLQIDRMKEDGGKMEQQLKEQRVSDCPSILKHVYVVLGVDPLLLYLLL